MKSALENGLLPIFEYRTEQVAKLPPNTKRLASPRKRASDTQIPF